MRLLMLNVTRAKTKTKENAMMILLLVTPMVRVQTMHATYRLAVQPIACRKISSSPQLPLQLPMPKPAAQRWTQSQLIAC